MISQPPVSETGAPPLSYCLIMFPSSSKCSFLWQLAHRTSHFAISALILCIGQLAFTTTDNNPSF